MIASTSQNIVNKFLPWQFLDWLFGIGIPEPAGETDTETEVYVWYGMS